MTMGKEVDGLVVVSCQTLAGKAVVDLSVESMRSLILSRKQRLVHIDSSHAGKQKHDCQHGHDI